MAVRLKGHVPRTASTKRAGAAHWSLPEDPRERRRFRNRLIALAVAIPIAQLIRLVFR